MKTWNRERKRTRDRLLEYDFCIVPPHPHSAGLPMVYPWENTNLSMLSYQLFYLAQKAGFTGTEEEFFARFGNNDGHVIKGTLSTFPQIGDTRNLYLDEETGIVYYFKQTSYPVIVEVAARVGVAIVGKSLVGVDNTEVWMTNLYIPIRALLIEDTILDCGDAAEFIG